MISKSIFGGKEATKTANGLKSVQPYNRLKPELNQKITDILEIKRLKTKRRVKGQHVA